MKSHLGKRSEEQIKQDIEADCFARNLLMPTEMIKEKLKSLFKDNGGPYISETEVKQIAKYFEVPEMQAFIRIQEITKEIYR